MANIDWTQVENAIKLLPECETEPHRTSLLMSLTMPILREIAKRCNVPTQSDKRTLVKAIASSRRARVATSAPLQDRLNAYLGHRYNINDRSDPGRRKKALTLLLRERFGVVIAEDARDKHTPEELAEITLILIKYEI